MAAFDLLAELTARLAATARLDEIVDAVLHDIVELGFGSVWMAVLDEQTGSLTTLKNIVDGVDLTREVPVQVIDPREPLGRGFHERRMINVRDPSKLIILERGDEEVPPDRLALPRAVYDRLHGGPFACGPLLGSRRQPVGALGLSSYLGNQPIPDAVFAQGLLRVLMDHLGIAMERALHVERLDANLVEAQAAIVNDARLKTIGELAVAVAHDLNNLSGIALLAVGVGLRSPADAFEVLPRIERANRAMGDLVARLQRLARPSTGNVEVADLRQTVDDILIMVKPILHERSVQVDAELSPVPPVRCDPVLLHQVILNLLINANDALGEVASDRRRVMIRAQHEGEIVRVTVADTGPGLPPAVLANLFQPFNTTKGSAHMGLGLAGARAQLEHAGGRLDGRNGPAGGAVFEITLGVATVELPDRAAPVATRPVTERARRIRILAVDDDPDVVYIIREYLEPLGYEVVTATASGQALELAKSQPFDLLLCDLGMPKQSGFEVCQLLRSGGYHGKLVLMTGWDSYSLTTDQRAAQCDMVLKKPFVGTDLIHVIESLLA